MHPHNPEEEAMTVTSDDPVVTDATAETIGMIKARRWSSAAYTALAVLAGGLLYTEPLASGALVIVGWVIHTEAARTRAAQWPECYNAVRRAIQDHEWTNDPATQRSLKAFRESLSGE